MKSLRKIISIVLCLIIMSGFFSQFNHGLSDIFALKVSAETVAEGFCGSEGGFITWELNENGVLTISGNGVMAKNDVDSSYDRFGWHEYIDRITTAIIEEGVTWIGDYAFRNLVNLENVTIADTVSRIGTGAFENTAVFNDESNWEDGVLYIDDCLIAVKEDFALSQYAVREGTVFIASEAFYNKAGLNDISLPDSIRYIGENAFYGTGFYNDTSNWENGLLYIGNHLIKADPAQIIGDCFIRFGTISIATCCFGNRFGDFEGPASVCTNLKKIVIPPSVKAIGFSSFAFCRQLEEVVTYPGLEAIADFAFEGCNKLESFGFKNGLKIIGCGAFNLCSRLDNISFPESVISIGCRAFFHCNRLHEVNIPSYVSYVGWTAFSLCWELMSINVDPDNTAFKSSGNCLIQTANGALMAGCNNSVIPKDGSVKSIESGAFWGSIMLKEIVIPDGVTFIADHAFADCIGLKYIVLPDTLEEMDAFWQYVTFIAGYSTCETGEFAGLEEEYNEAINNGYDHVDGASLETVKYIIDHPQPSLTDIYYTGTEAQWNSIRQINYYDFLDATIHFSATDHIIVPDERVEPTCTESGVTAGSHCLLCDNQTEPQEVIPALGHDFEQTDVINDEYGNYDYSCYVYTCKECGYEYRHYGYYYEQNYEYWATLIDSTPSSCTEEGTYIYATYDENGQIWGRFTQHEPPRGHCSSEPVIENEVQQTCTRNGSYDEVIYCSICGEELERETHYDYAYGHCASEPVIENEVQRTCTRNGSYDEVRYCSVCGEELERQTHYDYAYGHCASEPVVENVIPCTCSHDGSYEDVYYCEVCGEELARYPVTIYASGYYHHWNYRVENYTITATCDVCGETCSVSAELPANMTCSGEEKEITINGELPAILSAGIQYRTPDGRAPTTAGVYTAYFDVYQYNVDSHEDILAARKEIVMVVTHDMVNHLGTEPTCIEDGCEDYSECAYCGYNNKRIIPALGHSYITVKESEESSNTVSYHEECSKCGLLLENSQSSYVKGNNVVTLTQLIQRLFDFIFGRFKALRIK